MIPHSKPLITGEDILYVSGVLSGGNIAPGKVKEQFEKDVCKIIDLKNSAAVSNGTAAIFCALKAMGVSNESEVIIPAYVCSAVLYAVKMAGAVPVLADSGEQDIFHIDAGSVKKVLTKRTEAVIFPHMFGSANDLKDIISFGVPVIEDCAMALGAEYESFKAGNLGSAASVFSFYATKVITTGEGGMVLSGDSGLIEKIRDFTSYADKNDGLLHFNLAMPDFAAALGVSQLERLAGFIERRRMIAEKYSIAFKNLAFDLPLEKEKEKSIYYRYVVRTGNLEQLRTRLREKGIAAERPVYLPLSRYKTFETSCPNAEKAWNTALSIPIYPAMSDSDMDKIIETVLDIFPEK